LRAVRSGKSRVVLAYQPEVDELQVALGVEDEVLGLEVAVDVAALR